MDNKGCSTAMAPIPVPAMSLEKETRIAIEAVVKACRLCQNVRATLSAEGSLTKEDSSPVTVADFGAQALTLNHLGRTFPTDPVIAEEDLRTLLQPEAAALKSQVIRQVQNVDSGLDESTILHSIDHGRETRGASRYWTLDPIDGTKGFLRNDQYAVALALIEEGEIVLGVLGCPSLPMDPARPEDGRGCLFVAASGTGSRMYSLEGKALDAIRVSKVREPKDASLCESVESGHSKHDWAAAVANTLGIQAPPVRMDSQCKYAAIARGEASIYLRLPTRPGYQEKIWDHAAGVIVVREAGGKVTDIEGRELDFSRGSTLDQNRGVIASNGTFHDQIVEAALKNAPAS